MIILSTVRPRFGQGARTDDESVRPFVSCGLVAASWKEQRRCGIRRNDCTNCWRAARGLRFAGLWGRQGHPVRSGPSTWRSMTAILSPIWSAGLPMVGWTA